MDYIGSGLATTGETAAARHAIADMITFCLDTSRERVRAPSDGRPFDVITALVPPPHSRMSKFFWQVKSDLGFGLYVPDCDTTACSFSAATQFGSDHPILDQPYIDFVASYQVGNNNHGHQPTVTINDNIDYDGAVGILDRERRRRPSVRQRSRSHLESRRARGRLPQSRALADRRESPRASRRCAGSCGSSIGWRRPAPSPTRARTSTICPSSIAPISAAATPPSRRCRRPSRAAIDPDGAFEAIRRRVLAYVRDDLMAAEMNPFDAALALLALAKLGAEPRDVRAGAGLHRPQLRRRPLGRAVQGLRMEQDEDADPDPGRRPGGDVGLRAVGAGACAGGVEKCRSVGSDPISPSPRGFAALAAIVLKDGHCRARMGEGLACIGSPAGLLGLQYSAPLSWASRPRRMPGRRATSSPR